jgi:hypothetical protein
MIALDHTPDASATQAAIAEVVALFSATTPSPIPVAWLGARALWSVGDHEMAAGIAGTLLPQFPDARAALHHAGYPPALAWLLHLGVLRPQRWQHEPDTVTWILDFAKLRRDAFGELALPSQRTLHLILAAAASLWDADSGAGALALKGWPATRRRARTTPTLTREEVEDFCRATLARHQAQRRWRVAPRLLRLR